MEPAPARRLDPCAVAAAVTGLLSPLLLSILLAPLAVVLAAVSFVRMSNERRLHGRIWALIGLAVGLEECFRVSAVLSTLAR